MGRQVPDVKPGRLLSGQAECRGIHDAIGVESGLDAGDQIQCRRLQCAVVVVGLAQLHVAGALHALMLQVRVEAKALCGQGLARDLGHGTKQGARLLECKADLAFGAGERDQWQCGAHLDAKCTAVSQKHVRQVRTKVSRKGRCMLLSCGAGLEQIVFACDNTDREDIVSGGAALTAAPKNAVLGEATPNRRVAAGQRAPIGCAHAEWHRGAHAAFASCTWPRPSHNDLPD